MNRILLLATGLLHKSGALEHFCLLALATVEGMHLEGGSHIVNIALIPVTLLSILREHEEHKKG